MGKLASIDLKLAQVDDYQTRMKPTKLVARQSIWVYIGDSVGLFIVKNLEAPNQLMLLTVKAGIRAAEYNGAYIQTRTETTIPTG